MMQRGIIHHLVDAVLLFGEPLRECDAVIIGVAFDALLLGVECGCTASFVCCDFGDAKWLEPFNDLRFVCEDSGSCKVDSSWCMWFWRTFVNAVQEFFCFREERFDRFAVDHLLE